MVLARITDTCRKHGAIIISGHHHIYSRTYMLKSVGSDQGEDPIRVSDRSNKLYVQEGITISITAGMGGYDGSCNGKYWNATWMDKCISRPSDHRGAVIAEFDEQDTRIGYFKYMNSLKDGEVVDEFQIQSKLPGSNSKAPTSSPSKRKPSREPTESPSPEPTHDPTHLPTERANPTRKPSAGKFLLYCFVFHITPVSALIVIHIRLYFSWIRGYGVGIQSVCTYHFLSLLLCIIFR
jgi:hypothetical protein